MTAPSILVVDEGELDGVQTLLERLCVDWVRCAEPDPVADLPRPRDLIISSGPRTMAMPKLVGEGEPVWICLYDQDFLPLRESLTGLGVHYLVSQALDLQTLELFVRQLLYTEGERRRVRRIPVRQEVSIEIGMERRKGFLVELSPDSGLFTCDEVVPSERRVRLRMPVQTLTGHEEIDLEGAILRRCPAVRGNGDPCIVHVFRFDALDPESMGALQQTLAGDALDADVTPLASEPQPCDEDADAIDEAPEIELVDEVEGGPDTPPVERRGRERRPYRGRVSAIRWQGESEPSVVLGRDLSLSGMRIATRPTPEPGTEVALALYGGGREEPVLVEAEVVRVDGGECGLRFTGLAPDVRVRLAALLDGTPRIERIAGHREVLCVATLSER